MPPGPHTQTHTWGIKGAGQQKQTRLEHGLFILKRGHRRTEWPPTLQTEHVKFIDVY